MVFSYSVLIYEYDPFVHVFLLFTGFGNLKQPEFFFKFFFFFPWISTLLIVIVPTSHRDLAHMKNYAC